MKDSNTNENKNKSQEWFDEPLMLRMTSRQKKSKKHKDELKVTEERRQSQRKHSSKSDK